MAAPGHCARASDVARLLEQRAGGFDPDIYVALLQLLPRVNAKSLRVLPARKGGRVAADMQTTADEDC